MSWSGFIKGVNRASTTLLQKAGAIEKTVDPEYEQQEQKYKNLESRVTKLSKDAKNYLDNVRIVCAAQKRMSENVCQFYGEMDEMSLCALKYRDLLDSIDTKLRAEMDELYRKTMLDPITRYTGYFPIINEVIKKRQKKLLDYDAARAKTRKLVDNPSDDAEKLPKAEQTSQQAKEIYDSVNSHLIRELPVFVNYRAAYLDPCFEAMVKCQVKFAKDSIDRLVSIERYFPEPGNIDQILEEMKTIMT